MYILEVSHRTLFTKFLGLYPECEFLIRDQPHLYPLLCLQSSCPRASNCMEKLAKRVKAVFDAFPSAKLLVLYFTYRDQPGRIRAGVFWEDMSEPRFIVMNPSAWEKFKEIGTVYEWDLPLELRLS